VVHHDTRRGRFSGWRTGSVLLLLLLTFVIAACSSGNTGGGSGAASESAAASTDASSGGSGSAAPSGSEGAGGALEPPTNNVAIEFWTGFTGADGDTMEALVSQFNSETPTVQVTLQRLPEYYTAINNAVQAGETPQVMIMHIDALARYAAEEVVQPVTDLSEQLGLSEEDFTPAVWAGTMWKDVQYSVPLDVHPQVLYYNRALLEEVGAEVPTDRETFEDALQKCTDAGYDQGVWGNHAFSAGLTWVSLFYQGGGEWTNEDYTEATFNSPAGVQATEYMQSLIEMGVQPQNVDPDAELTNLESQSSCFATTGIWQTTRLQASLGEDFGETPFPQIFDQPGNWAGSHTLAIAADVSGDELQGAYYFIDWLTSHTVEWAAGGQLPARTDVRESEEFAALADIPDVAPAIDAARFPPPIPGSGDMFFGPGGVWEVTAEALTSGADPQAGLDAAAEQYTQTLQEGKEEYGY
jgi:multiple sugar transport system substrate-binding protein